MLTDYFSEINDHGTVVPVKDLAAFPRSEQAVLGAENFIINDAQSSGSFTVNTDKSITFAGGTVSSRVDFPVGTTPCKPNTKYVLTGCPSGGSLQKYMLTVREKKADNTNLPWHGDYGDGVEFITDSECAKLEVYISIFAQEEAVPQLLYKPELSLSKPVMYQPPTLSNRELTDKALLVSLAYAQQDDLKKTGIYRVNNYGFVQVLNFGDGVIHQIFLVDAEPDVIYKRVFSNNAWGSFYKITGTIVS